MNKGNKSLVALLRAIKFRKPRRNADTVERDFAQLHPRARQHSALAEEANWVRSAN